MTKLRFFLLNAIGGTAVLGSYAWGIGLHPELREAFWGGVPEHVRGLYTVNMFLAAGGFLLTFAYWMLKAGDDARGRLLWPYTLILLPSALWLPLTVAVLKTGVVPLWWLTCLDLLAVGAGGIWVWARLMMHQGGAPMFRRAALVALSFFVLQTAVLDGLIWPAYFQVP